MPTGPNTHPQKSRETKTTKVERPKPFPSILGSSILPILILITRYPAAERRAVIRPPSGEINARSAGGTAAMIDPTVGT